MDLIQLNSKLVQYNYIYCKALAFHVKHLNTIDASWKSRITYYVGYAFYEIVCSIATYAILK